MTTTTAVQMCASCGAVIQTCERCGGTFCSPGCVDYGEGACACVDDDPDDTRG